jgi:hypothetical protein
MEFKSFTGLRSDRPQERFDPTDLSVATNVNIDNSGGIALRDGYTLVPTVAAGAKHSAWSDDTGTIGLYVMGSSLYSMNAYLTSTAVMTGLTPGLRMAYWRVLNRVYFSNGAQTGVFENGAVRSWGLTPPTAASATITVGQMLAGSYQYTMTFMRNDGQESGAMLASRIDVLTDGAGFTFTMPVSTDPTVVSVGVYISTRNSEVMYLAMVVPVGQATATYANDTSELNLPLITQFLGPAPAGHMIRYYRGRVYVAVGDTLYPSEDLSYEWFDLRKGIPLDGRVTLFSAMDDPGGDGVFVGTDRSCGVLIGKGPSEFEYVQKMGYGAIEGASVFVDGSLYGDDSQGSRILPMWLTTQGICVGLPSMEVRNITRTRYKIAATGKGAGIFIPDPNRLILTANL